jgi:serine/threonine protein kinase/ActR/RegA family two-component response regulator
MPLDRILVVDDEEEIRTLIALALRDEGLSVITASNGSEALARIVREKPALVILDLLMPEISGEDVCRAIKRDPALNEIVVVILSAKSDLESRLNCLKIGAEEYLVKPIDLTELVMRINHFLKLMNRTVSVSRPDPNEIDPIATSDLSFRTLPTVHRPEVSAAAPKINGEIQPETTDTKIRYGVYRLESLAGKGGMGLVYKAYDETLDRYVAVKVLSQEWSSSPEFLERFRTEAKLIAAINHPGIAQIYTFGEEASESYFALQWCPGGSLSELIRKEGKVELLPAIDMVLQAARGLEAASMKNVVHRDIKPSNLMFDENRQIKIVDFGVASSEQAQEGDANSVTVVGSPAYMSPEQGRGESTDHRSDIYSLGITFYQMLYGRLPFSANGPLEWVAQHIKQPFPPYDDLNGQIPPAAYEVIERMTRKNREARYKQYSDLIKDLEHLRNELYRQKRFKIPAARSIAPVPSITNNNAIDLLAAIFHQQASGVLKASWARLEKQFVIHRNEIVLFESPQNDENVWSALVDKRWMDRKFIPAQREGLEESLNRLLFLHAFTPEHFKTAYRETMMQSIMQVFRWPVFHGEFYKASIEHEAFAVISIARLFPVAAGVMPFEMIDRAVPRDQFIVRSPNFAELLTTLNLGRTESFLVSRIEGDNVTIETLGLLTGFSSELICRTVYALQRLGALEYRNINQMRAKRALEKLAGGQHAVAAAHDAVSGSTPVTQTAATAAVSGSVPVIQTNEVNITPESSQKVEWIDNRPAGNAMEATKYFKLAEEKFKSGQYWDSKQYCLQAIMNNAGEAKYHHLMARCLMRYPHSSKAAEEAFREAIALDVGNIDYRLDLVTFLKDRGHLNAAKKECESILEIAWNDKRARRLLREIELGG